LEDQDIANVQIAVEIVFLRREADATSGRAPIALDVVTEERDRTRCDLRKPDDRVDRRRLPRAVGPSNPKNSPSSTASEMPSTAVNSVRLREST